MEELDVSCLPAPSGGRGSVVLDVDKSHESQHSEADCECSHNWEIGVTQEEEDAIMQGYSTTLTKSPLGGMPFEWGALIVASKWRHTAAVLLRPKYPQA